MSHLTRLTRFTFRIHRWLAYGVGIQLVLWVAGGLVFALLPFQAWVKGGDVLRKPQPVLAAEGAATLASALARLPSADITGLTLVATPVGAVLKLTQRGGADPVFLPADGRAWVAPDADAVGRFAGTLYTGPGRLAEVARAGDGTARRLGIVDETAGRAGLWRVRFDDALSTRLYFDGHSGEFVALRNEAWVWYDFFWRLHIMDYSGGEDFNHKLLRVAAIAAGLMVAAGAVLSVLAARRALRRRRAT
jgi:uncharacterized iron-regulated membrane protein